MERWNDDSQSAGFTPLLMSGYYSVVIKHFAGAARRVGIAKRRSFTRRPASVNPHEILLSALFLSVVFYKSYLTTLLKYVTHNIRVVLFLLFC
jgi:hypothetical protein